jgi:hypothetical protein
MITLGELYNLVNQYWVVHLRQKNIELFITLYEVQLIINNI